MSNARPVARLSYIANIRLPTERAHGLQVMKMCEAFAATGAKIELVIPRKRHTSGGTDDPFSYYGVERTFQIHRVNSLDLLGLTERLGRLFYILDIVSFILTLYSRRPPQGSVIYAREPLLLFPFSEKKYRICLEIHDIRRTKLFLSTVRRAHKLIVLTTILKEDLIALGIEAGKILVAPDGVDLREFEQEEEQEARAQVGIPTEGQYVVYTGHFFEWKGVDILARAADSAPDTTFVFVGGVEPELSRFSKKFASVRNVLIVPHVPHSQVRHYLNAADVLVLPNSAKEEVSRRYTSPLKLFEYMAVKKPIVASRLPSICDVLDDSNAILVVPDDSDDLLRGIREAMQDREGARIARAYEKVLTLTWQKRAERILEYVSAV